MTRPTLTLTAVALGAACASSSGPPAAAPAPVVGVEQAAASITPDDMYRRIAWLASDELGGRNTPSPGLEMAAKYIADEFRAFGLSPAGDSGTFIQRYPYTRSGFVADRTSLRFDLGGKDTALRYGVDFFVLPGTGDTASGGLAWGGTAKPGMTAFPESAAGRMIVMFMPGAQPEASWNGIIGAAFGAAIPARASGLILVLDPQFNAAMIPQIAEAVAAQQAPIPLVGVPWAAVQGALAAAGEDLEALRDAPFRTLDGGTAMLTVGRTRTETRPPNVVGLLRGSDPLLRDQYIVFSAHMDHVGTAAPDAEGDSIFNGADDDASGTATVLEVAEAFASLGQRPRRSLIFLAVSGEEKGLLGSDYFASNPPVAKEKIVANINLDMVGRNAPDTVVAIGQDYSSLGPLVQEVIGRRPELGLVVAPDLWPQENLFLRSDHFSFAKNGIPALFFTTGLHDQYHKQSDEADLIDRDKITRIGRLAFYLAVEIAARDQPPVWTEEGRRVVAGAGR
jgi:hypothetical protein